MGFFTALLTFAAAILNIVPVDEQKAPEASTILRPSVSYGQLDLSGERKDVSTGTLQLMRDSGRNQRYGFEYSRMEYLNSDIKGADSLGIVLEQVLPGGALISLTALNHIDYQKNEHQIFGLVTNLGWEYQGAKHSRPFIAYRTNSIFVDGVDVLHSLNVGWTVRF